MTDDASKTDYKATVFLPKTDFPMRGSLAEREPEHLKRWQEIDLWGKLRRASAGREKFILHDGPPYPQAQRHPRRFPSQVAVGHGCARSRAQP